jgi:hypothetical protein
MERGRMERGRVERGLVERGRVERTRTERRCMERRRMALQRMERGRMERQGNTRDGAWPRLRRPRHRCDSSPPPFRCRVTSPAPVDGGQRGPRVLLLVVLDVPAGGVGGGVVADTACEPTRTGGTRLPQPNAQALAVASQRHDGSRVQWARQRCVRSTHTGVPLTNGRHAHARHPHMRDAHACATRTRVPHTHAPHSHVADEVVVQVVGHVQLLHLPEAGHLRARTRGGGVP